MGAKRGNWTIEDPSQFPPSPSASDRGNPSNDRINREARSQAGMKVKAERDREGEAWRAREMDSMWVKTRGGRREMEQDQRERKRGQEKDRRKEEGRHPNGRIASVQEYSEHKETERVRGDTFPRTRRRSNERTSNEKGTRLYVEQDYEKTKDRGMGRLREFDKTESERERERERAKKRDRDIIRCREAERLRENERMKIRDEIKRDNKGLLEKEESDRMRERGWEHGRRERRGDQDAEVNDQQIMRTKEIDRERDRAGHRDRDDWIPSLQRSRVMEGDRGNFSDREGRDEVSKAWRREKHRHTKSEGDSDGEEVRERRRKEATDYLRYEQSKSERDIDRERTRERQRDRERRREIEWQRERDRGKYRETDIIGYTGRKRDKEYVMERYAEPYRERDRARDERGSDRQREWLGDNLDRKREKEPSEKMRTERRRETDVYPEQKLMERCRSWEDGDKERSTQTQSETRRKFQEQAQCSGERTSGSDTEQKRREIKDSSEDKERESISESNREKRRSEEGQDVTREQREDGLKKEEKDREREKLKSKWRPQRKMWLEPRSEKAGTVSLEEEFRERERARLRYAQRYNERKASGEKDEVSSESKYERETLSQEDRYRQLEQAGEFMNDVDYENIEEIRTDKELVFENEGRFDTSWQMETENVEDNMEESDREEEKGSGRYGDSEGEAGSEREWGEGRERVTSGEDGFVTVSSGGDEDEAEEERFEDCKEFWDGSIRETLTRQSFTKTSQWEEEIETKMIEEKSERAVTVFCVVGQTVPRSGSHQNRLMETGEQEDTSLHSAHDPGDGGDHINEDIAPFRDSETAEESVKESCDMAGARADSINHGLTLSKEEITSNHDLKWEKAECDEKAQEVASPQHQEFTGNATTEKDTDSHPAECSETQSHTEDHGCAQSNMTVEEQQEKEIISTVEERKRYSAAPHVKWAKNVLKDILDSSDDEMLDMSELRDQTEQSREPKGDKEAPGSPIYGIIHKSPQPERKCLDPDLLQAKPKTTECAGHPDMKADMQNSTIHIQVEKDSASEEELEHLGLETEQFEIDTDEEDLYDRLLPSPDMPSFSSDGEIEKERSCKKDEKQKKKKTVWEVLSSSSFRELGNEAWGRRRGIRKMEKHSEDEEGGGIARDRRTRIFTTEEDGYDDLRHSFNESELSSLISKNFKARISRTRMRNSKFYNSQLYQQYSEVVQNREILHQSHSDASSAFGENSANAASSSPCSSPPPARRPLPPLPPVLHPVSLPQTNSRGTLNVPQHAPVRPSSPRLSRSFASSPMLWQELPGVKNNSELKNLSEDMRRLQEVRFEVVTSEASYCSSLDIVVEHFVKSKQLNAQLTTQDKNWLFSRLGDVRAISHSFYTQLEERVESDVMHFTICDIIIKHCPRFRAVYVPYLTNQSYQDKTYQRLMNENAGFRNIVEKLEQSPKCQRLPFRSFLILPFQRITRLKLLVQNIVKRTSPKTKDETEAIKAMKLLEKMIQDSNDSITQMKSIESLVSLNAKVDFECKTLPLISQSRRLVREGPVTELRDFSLKETERTAYIHLFNDYLLLSLPKEGGRFTVIDHAPVSELRAENCRVKLHSLQKNLIRLHMGRKSLLLRTETQADKLRWISAVSRPHPEVDLNAAQDIPQMQCIRAFVAQQPDEISLEKADVLLVHQQSSDGWVEGTRLSDRHRGWTPESHLEIIHSEKARKCNLLDALKITAATATV